MYTHALNSVRFGSFRFSCASRSFVWTRVSSHRRARETRTNRTEPNHARGRSGERDNLPNCDDDDDDDKEEEEDSFEKQRDDDDDGGDGFGRCR